MRLFIVFMQILLCCGKHKLDPVQLIYFAGTWIVVDGNNVGFRMLTANFLDDTFSYDVVRQASKRLDADDVRDTAVDEFHHLSGQEPSFTGLISGRNDGCSHFCKITDICGRCKVAALLQGLICCFSQPVDGSETKICDGCLGFLESKLFNLEILVVEAVADKVDKIRNNRFCPSASRRSARWLLAAGRNLTRISPTIPTRGFFSSEIGIVSKSWTISRHIFLKVPWLTLLPVTKAMTRCSPDFVFAVYDTLFQLVRTHAIYAFHQDITEYGTVNDAPDQRQCQLKARVALQSA